MANVDKKFLREQIYNLFAPAERMMAIKVSLRLEERTGGRVILPDRVVITCLQDLVSEGKLLVETKPCIIKGYSLNKTEYFLPEMKKA